MNNQPLKESTLNTFTNLIILATMIVALVLMYRLSSSIDDKVEAIKAKMEWVEKAVRK